MKKILSILVGALFLVSGCSTTDKRVSRINSYADPIIKEQYEALALEITGAKKAIAVDWKAQVAATARSANGANAAVPENADAVPSNITRTNVANARVDSYHRLKREKVAYDTKFSAIFDENKDRAATIAAWKTGIGISGLLAGIGATALVVASPANAVTVSVLSGYAGGVAGINGVFDSNGYSREQIAALESSVAEQYAEVSSEILLETLFTLAKDLTTSQDVWLKEIGKQEAAMVKLRALALTLRIPTGTPKP